jgi:hypothetical protein
MQCARGSFAATPGHHDGRYFGPATGANSFNAMDAMDAME